MANCVALTGGRRAAGRTLERRPALAREPSCAVAYVERIHGGYRWVPMAISRICEAARHARTDQIEALA